tara:strand:+ start:385 stop:1773 length:1389 start_codon:yes stop_codon:yes gene_type:complete
MADLQTSRTFKFKSCSLTDKKNQVHNILPQSFTFNYSEKITSPFVVGTLFIVDGVQLFNKIGFVGGEKVELTTEDVIQDGTSTEGNTYVMHVWKVANRYVKDKKSHYTLALVSREAMINEATRVNVPLEGTAEQIIHEQLIKNLLGSTKNFASDPSQFQMKLLGNRKRPFDIANMLTNKTIPQQKKWGDGTESSITSLTNDEATANIEGTAGYFFWESYKGYNFYSVDSLCKEDDDRPPWGDYEESSANNETGGNQLKLIQVKFKSETDVMTDLRVGKYSNLMVFFNPSSGQYDEYNFDLEKSYEKMDHLGGADFRIPEGNNMNFKSPSRVLSTILDSETWFSGPTPGDPDPEAGSKAPAPYADWQKYFAAQSLSRYSTLQNQECTVVIPGNSQICAGDRVKIKIRNKVPDVEARSEPWDRESSGVYLISEVTHEFDRMKGTSGIFHTTLRLCRDAYSGDVD